MEIDVRITLIFTKISHTLFLRLKENRLYLIYYVLLIFPILKEKPSLKHLIIIDGI